jgi:putative tryptophan/tyrosine transport system substrate-binding protein
MDRRAFIGSVAGSLVGAPLGAGAQATARIARIGYLAPSLSTEALRLIEAFRQGLREHGYVEGENIILELRSADGRADRFPALATELVALRVEVIVAGATLAVLPAKQATTTIPIVFPVHTDPVGAGLVASLARPGGNVTGLSFSSEDLTGKRVQLLKEIVPEVSQIAVLWKSPNAAAMVQLKAVEVAARALTVSVQVLEVRDAESLESAFRAATTGHSAALLIIDDPFTFLLRKRIVELALESRLPAMYGPREFVVDGGLIAYGANLQEMFRRAATYVAKILQGAKPADLPVEQPTKFELVINLKSAKALGLAIPQSLVTRADEVIQ